MKKPALLLLLLCSSTAWSITFTVDASDPVGSFNSAMSGFYSQPSRLSRSFALPPFHPQGWAIRGDGYPAGDGLEVNRSVAV